MRMTLSVQKKEAKIINMVMMFSMLIVAAIVSNERRYSISQMAEWRNNSVGVTNAGKAQRSMWSSSTGFDFVYREDLKNGKKSMTLPRGSGDLSLIHI